MGSSGTGASARLLLSTHGQRHSQHTDLGIHHGHEELSAPKGPAQGWEKGVALCYPLRESVLTLQEINLSPVGFATDKIPCTAT